MDETAQPAPPWEDYLITATNPATNTENLIHDDEVARSLGFAGGLVSGTTVFSYMTFPLVAHFGEPWLGSGFASLKLFKPVYAGDRLTVTTKGDREGAAAGAEVIASNQEGVAQALLVSQPEPPQKTAAPLASLRPPEKPPGVAKAEISWERLVLNKPFWVHRWRPGAAEQARWLENVGEPLPLYRRSGAAPLHPGMVLQAANDVFKEQFHLPAWIHVSSQITFRSVLRVGDEIEVRAVPREKFKKKGHQFVTLEVVMMAQGVPAVEVTHQAIFRVASPAS